MRRRQVALFAIISLCSLVLLACAPKDFALPIEQARLAAFSAVYTASDPAGGVMSVDLTREAEGLWHVATVAEVGVARVETGVELGADFTPSHSYVKVNDGQNEYEIDSTYDETQVTMEAITPNGPQKIERKITRPYYDNEQVFALVPAISLEPGKKHTFVLIATQSALKLTPTVMQVASQDKQPLVEQIETAVGLIDCHKLVLDIGLSGQPQQTFWVTTGAPHYVVKYSNGTIDYLLTELTIK